MRCHGEKCCKFIFGCKGQGVGTAAYLVDAEEKVLHYVSSDL